MASTLQQGAKKSSSQHHAREGRWGSLKGSAPKIASSPKAQGLTSNKLGAEGRRGPHLLALTGTYSLLPLTVSEPRCRAGPGTGPGGHQKLGDSYLQPLQGSPAQAAEGVPSLPPSSPASRVQGVPATGSKNLSGAAHQGIPAASLAPPEVPTLAVTAAWQRKTAEELGGAAAPPPTRRRGSGSGSQLELP